MNDPSKLRKPANGFIDDGTLQEFFRGFAGSFRKNSTNAIPCVPFGKAGGQKCLRLIPLCRTEDFVTPIAVKNNHVNEIVSVCSCNLVPGSQYQSGSTTHRVEVE